VSKKNKNPYAAKPLARRPKTERECMTCRHRFMSEGPHHRMCDACRRASVGIPEKMLAIGSGCHVTQPRRRGG
jgi:hypothetical protein